MIKKYHTIICGSGPSGLAAALASVTAGRRTLLAEKAASPGGKLPVSGSGKCNFSNTLSEEEFMASFGRNGRFMSGALKVFGKEKLLDYLSSQKVPPVVVDGLYYFPASLKAAHIRDAFLKPALERGLILKTQTRIDRLLIGEGQIRGVVLADGTELECEKFILCAGGNGMLPRGTTANGLALAAEAGHKITPPLPAMAPLFLKESVLSPLCGISLPDTALSLVCGNSSYKSRGTLLFTHDGLSGMAALNISDAVYRCFSGKPGKMKLFINFCAEKNLEDHMAHLEHLRSTEPEKLLKTALSTLFPKALAAALCTAAGLEEIKVKELKKHQTESFAGLLNAYPLVIDRIPPPEKAMAMSGGVSLKEIDPDTMESRLVKGLFFAGEVVDLTGPCGGFNIQFAFSSGYLAGIK